MPSLPLPSNGRQLHYRQHEWISPLHGMHYIKNGGRYNNGDYIGNGKRGRFLIVVMAFAFCFLFTAFGPLQSLATTVSPQVIPLCWRLDVDFIHLKHFFFACACFCSCSNSMVVCHYLCCTSPTELQPSPHQVYQIGICLVIYIFIAFPCAWYVCMVVINSDST
jgi:hypothetical protein